MLGSAPDPYTTCVDVNHRLGQRLVLPHGSDFIDRVVIASPLTLDAAYCDRDRARLRPSPSVSGRKTGSNVEG
jgi:hypothetical protein